MACTSAGKYDPDTNRYSCQITGDDCMFMRPEMFNEGPDADNGEDEDQIIFDEAACAEFIFNKLIEKGVAVSIEDIRMIMDFEYEYGVSIGIYPPPEVEGPK